jgi:hypothetical protein
MIVLPGQVCHPLCGIKSNSCRFPAAIVTRWDNGVAHHKAGGRKGEIIGVSFTVW